MKQLRDDQVPWTCTRCGTRMILTLRADDQVVYACDGCGGLHTEAPVVGACPKCEQVIETIVRLQEE